MNIAELIGELKSAVEAAKVAGDRVRQAIVHLEEIFGSIGPQITVTEPLFPLVDLNTMQIPCPYCQKMFRPYKPIRGHLKFPSTFKVSRHVAQARRFRTDHGVKGEPVFPKDESA